MANTRTPLRWEAKCAGTKTCRSGRVEAQGTLGELLQGCEEMQRLWRGELEAGSEQG